MLNWVLFENMEGLHEKGFVKVPEHIHHVLQCSALKEADILSLSSGSYAEQRLKKMDDRTGVRILLLLTTYGCLPWVTFPFSNTISAV